MPGFNDADNWCDANDTAKELSDIKKERDALRAQVELGAEDMLRLILENKQLRGAPVAIAEWLEGLSRHKACPSEKRFWYEGVAADIRSGVYLKR